MSDINTLIPLDQLKELTRRERKKQETRWKIYNAAIKLMSTHGYEKVKIDEICKLADVSDPAFFNHFTNKAALMTAYIDNIKIEVKNALLQNKNATPKEALMIIKDVLTKLFKKNGAFSSQLIFAFLGKHSKNWELNNPESGIIGLLTKIIKSGQEDGSFNKNTNPHLLAVSFCVSSIAIPLKTNDPAYPKEPLTDLLNFFFLSLEK